MSFASKVLYTGDGVVKSYNIPMPYISPSHISVFVDEILQLENMHYTFSGASTILFLDAPGDNSAIVIKRNTSPTATIVDFVNGSVLNEQDLDAAYLHNFYLGQEYSDSFNEVINEMLVSVATSQGVVETEPAAIIAALVTDMLDSANAANLQARITDIDANAEAIITLGDALQVQINTLASGVAAAIWIQPTAPVPGVGGVPNPIPEGSRWYDSDDNNHPYIYQSSAWFSIDDPRIGNLEVNLSVLQTEVDDNAAAIVAENLAWTTADSAFASELGLIGAQNIGQTAFIIDLNTAYVGPSESLASRFSTISASWAAADVTAVGDAAAYTDAEITTEQIARADADGAIASTISLMGAENGAGTAFILDENTVKIASDVGDTVAQRFSALVAADGVNSASITTIQTVTIPGVETTVTTAQNTANQASSDAGVAQSTADGAQTDADTANSAITGIVAEYGVDIDVNGYVTGFRIINGGTPGASAFVIRSDNFAIVDTVGGTLTEYVPFEISGGKINMRADVKIDGDLMVTGTINGSALINGTLGSTQIGANAITTTQLNANAVTAVKINANAVTADKISVTNLAAIEADLGSITAGNITLDTSGYIKGGQTAFDTGTGFFLGYEGGAYKFSIGNGTDFITWDGTDLIIRGDLSIGDYIASTSIEMLTANTLRNTTGLGWTEVKKFQINKPGQLRVYYTRDCTNTSGGNVSNSEVRIKLDGVVKDTDSFFTTTPSTQSYLLTTTSASQYVTIEITSGERNTVEPVPCGCNVWDVSLRGTIDWGEAVITD